MQANGLICLVKIDSTNLTQYARFHTSIQKASLYPVIFCERVLMLKRGYDR